MLMPAMAYKDEIENAFAKEIYSKEYFYYCGYAGCGSLPNIRAEDNCYEYAIVDRGRVVGYLAYKVDPFVDCVDSFGLYSFDRGNYVVGKDLFEEMERLVKRYHRVEWRMIGGNPVKRSYDKFCAKHGGNVAVLHDAAKDPDGKYCDVYFYEIVKGGSIDGGDR